MKETRKLFIFGFIFLLTTSLLFISGCNESASTTERQVETITISQDNFAYVDSYYLNNHYMDCENRNSGKSCTYTETGTCPETDIFMIYYKVLNLEYPYSDSIYCKVYDGTIDYKETQKLGVPQDKMGNMMLFLDYIKPHNIMVCCSVKDEYLASNEVCLPKINVPISCN